MSGETPPHQKCVLTLASDALFRVLGKSRILRGGAVRRVRLPARVSDPVVHWVQNSGVWLHYGYMIFTI